jgi:uncharacterized protein (TIGR03435 family)
MPSRLPLVLILASSLAFPNSGWLHAQPPAHKGPAAAIALAKTVQPYDVVSVKPNKSGGQSWGMKSGDTGLTATNVTLDFLIQFAYDIKPDFILGLSGPVASAHFDVEAKVVPQDGSTPKLPDEQILAMLIPVLADRFQLKAHLESQIKPVYDLVVAKGGLKIKLSQDEIHDSNWNTSFEGTNKVITAKGVRMIDLADALSNLAGRKVIDKTGLTGHADITLKWSDDVAAQQGGPDVISIFTALEDQLGLKLQPSKGPVDILVIDHAEMPTEN